MAFFDERSRFPGWHFFDLGGLFSQYFMLSECLALPPSARILTVGDYSCRDLQALGFCGFEVHAADLSPIPGMHPSMKFIALDLNDPAMIHERLQGPYDAIILGNVLEHVPNDHLALSALRAHVKGDGMLLLDVPLINPFARFPQDKPDYHIQVYTTRILDRLFGISGWRRERLVYRGVLLNWWYSLPVRGTVWLARKIAGERRSFGAMVSLAGWLARRGERSAMFRALCPWSWSYGCLVVLRLAGAARSMSAVNREHFIDNKAFPEQGGG